MSSSSLPPYAGFKAVFVLEKVQRVYSEMSRLLVEVEGKSGRSLDMSSYLYMLTHVACAN